MGQSLVVFSLKTVQKYKNYFSKLENLEDLSIWVDSKGRNESLEIPKEIFELKYIKKIFFKENCSHICYPKY